MLSPQLSQAKSISQKSTFLTLWLLCILGSLSVLPYVHYLGVASSSHSFTKMFLLVTAQSALLFGIVCWLSSLLVRKTDLAPFSLATPLRRIVYPSLIAGVLLGFTIYLFEVTLFKGSQLSGVAHPPAWAGLIASLYGGINEEVLLRLFLFTSLYFLFRKIFKFETQNRLSFLWVVNILVALVFGIGHLPTLFKLATPSSFEIYRVLLFNGIGGLVFGWLYWSRGLWTAIGAHFVTDLVIHVFLV